MGGFLKSIASTGLTGAATAAGGPLAGAGAAAGMGMADSIAKGGSLGDMLFGGAKGAGGAYIGGQLGSDKLPSQPSLQIPDVPQFKSDFAIDTGPKSLLEALKFNY